MKKEADARSLWYKRGLCFTIFLVYEIVLFNSTLGDKSVAFSLDVSPLYELELTQNIDIEKVVQILQEEHSGSLREISIYDFRNDTTPNKDLLCSYGFHLFENAEARSIRITGSIRWYENAMIAKSQNDSGNSLEYRNIYKNIKISKDVEIAWSRAMRDRLADVFNSLQNYYYYLTYIRIQNMVIIFHENSGLDEEPGAFTSTNIKWLCDAIEKSQKE